MGIIAHVMEKIVRQGMLFDLYGELLTEHQREIYGCLVNDDMSLSELAEQSSAVTVSWRATKKNSICWPESLRKRPEKRTDYGI